MLGKHPHLCPVNTLREGHIKVDLGTFLVSTTVVRFRAPNAGGAGFIPGQELRSHMPHSRAKKKKKKDLNILGSRDA